MFFVQFLIEDTNTAPLISASEKEKAALLNLENSENLPPLEMASAALKRHRLKTKSPVDRMFSFMTESVVRCSACRYESCTFYMDQMMNLCLKSQNGSSTMDLRVNSFFCFLSIYLRLIFIFILFVVFIGYCDATRRPRCNRS